MCHLVFIRSSLSPQMRQKRESSSLSTSQLLQYGPVIETSAPQFLQKLSPERVGSLHSLQWIKAESLSFELTKFRFSYSEIFSSALNRTSEFRSFNISRTISSVILGLSRTVNRTSTFLCLEQAAIFDISLVVSASMRSFSNFPMPIAYFGHNFQEILLSSKARPDVQQ